MVCALIVTVLFMNGQSLGITLVVDADSEAHSDNEYFTENDQLADWDTSSATYITLDGKDISISGANAYEYDGNLVISNSGKYVISGTLDDGYITVDANENSKVWLFFNGVDISCSDNACLRVDEADKVFLTLAEGTENTLTGGEELSEEALEDGTYGVIFAHDDLTINGSGSLQITAGYKHGIKANDDLVITGGTITIDAPADGIHVNDSFRLKEADVTITAEDDGILTENEESFFYLESGKITVDAKGDGIHSNGDIIIAGGTITMNAGDDGLHADGDAQISDGVIEIDSCYEGIEAVTITVSGGDITVYPTDDGFNANGGSNSMGNMFGGGMGPGNMGTESETWRQEMEATVGEMPTPPDGEMPVMSDGEMPTPPDGEMPVMSDGEMPTPPDGEMPVMSDGEMPTLPDGEIPVMSNGEMPTPSDGEMPAEGALTEEGSESQTGIDTLDEQGTDQEEEESYILISGGTITIINENGNDADGLDSNGSLYITGGDIRISLVNNGTNSAIDVGTENGGIAEISGGTIIACGSSSMAEAFDATSTQASIMYNVSAGIEAGSLLMIEDEEGEQVLNWEVPCSFSSAVISSPMLQTGGTYTVVAGDNEETITLSEISASFGDAQSSMFGGNMNWGGMRRRDRGTDSTGGTGQAESAASEQTGAEAVEPESAGAEMAEAAPEIMGSETGDAQTTGTAPTGPQTGEEMSLFSYDREIYVLLLLSFLVLGVGLIVAKKYRRS